VIYGDGYDLYCGDGLDGHQWHRTSRTPIASVIRGGGLWFVHCACGAGGLKAEMSAVVWRLEKVDAPCDRCEGRDDIPERSYAELRFPISA
jgi:hypothetical protein